jgi:tetratricopeptide (TPR) repeat protein
MESHCPSLSYSDPSAVIRPEPGEWHPRMPERLEEEELADWRAGRNAIYQLAALTDPRARAARLGDHPEQPRHRALSRLGERENGTERLLEAVEAYRDALKEWTRERVPLRWATTQNNLGTALSRLGERENGTERLLEAVEAYRDALEEWTRERVPLQWATTQNNLGNAQAVLNERFGLLHNSSVLQRRRLSGSHPSS